MMTFNSRSERLMVSLHGVSTTFISKNCLLKKDKYVCTLVSFKLGCFIQYVIPLKD